MNSQSAPKLTIIAGPNGSGKSTLTRYIQSNLDAPIIDPDAEARKINPSSPRRRYILSLTNLPIALQLADNAIIFDNSTNLGHQRKLTIENRKITQQSESLPEWLINSVTLEQLISNQSESTAQS